KAPLDSLQRPLGGVLNARRCELAQRQPKRCLSLSVPGRAEGRFDALGGGKQLVAFLRRRLVQASSGPPDLSGIFVSQQAQDRLLVERSGLAGASGGRCAGLLRLLSRRLDCECGDERQDEEGGV